MVKSVVFVLLLCLLVIHLNQVVCKPTTPDVNGTAGDKQVKGIVIFKVYFDNVATPFVVCCWVLLASLAKIGFHHSEWLSSTIPESCLLILLGVPIGLILKALHVSSNGSLYLTSNLFFYFLLPPIILDAGYFMPSQVFYLNIGTILLYAVMGTIFNTFAVGATLYAVSGICDVQISILHALLFGSLISAVDPVAVLAIFEEVHVNEILYMLVFGESVLNDAASVVLYRTFEVLAEGKINAEQVGLAIASFFVVSIGGTIIGVVFALLTSFITRFTEHVRVIEPVFVFLMAYMAYLSAEIFHFSGIVSILFCGIIMKPYVESNVSRKSHTTIKYFLKLISTSCESVIFMFLGVSLVQSKHKFNWSFVLFTLLFITIYRAFGVAILTAFANKCGRITKVKKVEQLIMSYGGLRGAVAFCLAVLLKEDNDEMKLLKQIIVTTTISVVIFTVFVQGTTIKKLVDVLGVKKSQKREKSMAETLNDRVLGYMVAGVEEIIGVHGHGFWRNILEVINKKYLRYWLERDPDLALDEEILYAQRRIAFKHALEYANNPAQIFAREIEGQQLSTVKRNPSYALELAIRGQQQSGNECGLLDIKILAPDGNQMNAECNYSDAFNPRSIACLIPKAKKMEGRKRTYSTNRRKYTLDSLDEREAFEDRYLKYKRSSLCHIVPSSSSRSHHHHKRHKHRKHKGHSRKPGMDTLPELLESDDIVLDIKSTYDRSKTKTDSGSDSDSDGGIMFKTATEPLTSQDSKDYMPALPTYSNTSPHHSGYENNPLLDNRSKQLTERDKEELAEASRWRSFSVDSYSPKDNDNVLVDVRSPWADLPSSPVNSHFDDYGGSAGKYRERTYSMETGF